MTKSWLATILATTLIASSALAAPHFDDFQRTKTEAAALQLGPLRPFGGLETAEALSHRWSVNTFYVVWTGSGSARIPHWIIRRSTGSIQAAPVVRWADSRSCPAVRLTMETLKALPLPLPDVPGIGAPRELSLVLDGEGHELWLNWAAYPNGASGGLRMDGNVDSPIALWWQAALPQLETCWTDKIPT
jgi:hypothetical protein